MGSAAPISLANTMVRANETATARATITDTSGLPRSSLSIRTTLTKVATPTRAPAKMPTVNSLRMTLKRSLNSISPRERLRITVTEDCPPELPPVPIIIGTNKTSAADNASSNIVRIADDIVAENIRSKSHGSLAFKKSKAEVLR